MAKLGQFNDLKFTEAQKRPNCLYVAQILLTPGKFDTIKVGWSVYNLTKNLQCDGDAPKWFRNHKNGRLNVILLDFAFGCNIGSESGFIDEIINSN